MLKGARSPSPPEARPSPSARIVSNAQSSPLERVRAYETLIVTTGTPLLWKLVTDRRATVVMMTMCRRCSPLTPRWNGSTRAPNGVRGRCGCLGCAPCAGATSRTTGSCSITRMTAARSSSGPAPSSPTAARSTSTGRSCSARTGGAPSSGRPAAGRPCWSTAGRASGSTHRTTSWWPRTARSGSPIRRTASSPTGRAGSPSRSTAGATCSGSTSAAASSPRW